MTRVYRLVVEYPPRSQEPGWEPPGWEPPHPFQWPRELDRDRFSWPRERLYLSRSGANTGAGLFRKYGAEVTIERSEPVQWPGGAS